MLSKKFISMHCVKPLCIKHRGFILIYRGQLIIIWHLTKIKIIGTVNN